MRLSAGSNMCRITTLLCAAIFLATAPAAAQQPTTERVSVASDGTEGHGVSFITAAEYQSISHDGRYVAFPTPYYDIYPGNTNFFCGPFQNDDCKDIVVHDRLTGTTERVSVASDGTEANHESIMAAISGNGRYVAFTSRADNLVPDDTNNFPYFSCTKTNTGGNIIWDNCPDAFVHDRVTGTTERVSVASDGTEGNHASGVAHNSLSHDGRYVAFGSEASNLVPDDTNDQWDVFVHDRETGTTERVSVAPDGTGANDDAVWPAISADGRYVAFHSSASNLVPDDTSNRDIFVRDLETGTTERVSVASDGTEANNESRYPTLSGDGRYVAFGSEASNLVPDDTNDQWDVFVHDRETGVTERVSVASDGTEANGGLSWRPMISADGRYIAFQSVASNLVPDDTNDESDIFVHDRETGTTVRVSVAYDGTEGNDRSFHFPAISADGRQVAFFSRATNLVPGDTNDFSDVFVRDLNGGPPGIKLVFEDGFEADTD